MITHSMLDDGMDQSIGHQRGIAAIAQSQFKRCSKFFARRGLCSVLGFYSTS
jgi:hypothetical protein